MKTSVHNKDLHMNVYTTLIHNSSKLETTLASISEWMNKQNMLYWYKRNLFIDKKEQTTNTSKNIINLKMIVLDKRK